MPAPQLPIKEVEKRVSSDAQQPAPLLKLSEGVGEAFLPEGCKEQTHVESAVDIFLLRTRDEDGVGKAVEWIGASTKPRGDCP